MPDDRSVECYDCTAKFTSFRRRHHCRVCGQVNRLYNRRFQKHFETFSVWSRYSAASVATAIYLESMWELAAASGNPLKCAYNTYLLLTCTVPGLETDRWKYYNCIIPESCRAVQFLLFVSMCLVLVLSKFKLPKTLTFCLRGFVRYHTKVQVSLFEKQKLTSLNIRIASFLSAVGPCSFSCLSVCVFCWYWQKFQGPKT
jgi:hypothetical protein